MPSGELEGATNLPVPLTAHCPSGRAKPHGAELARGDHRVQARDTVVVCQLDARDGARGLRLALRLGAE